MFKIGDVLRHKNEMAIAARVLKIEQMVAEYEGCESLDCRDMIYDTVVAIGATDSDEEIARSVAFRVSGQG